MPRVWEPACCSTEVWGSTVPLAASPGSTARTINVKACGLGSARITPSTYLNYYIYIYITILYIYIYVYNYTIYIWVRLEIPYPHWKVCLGGMLRRYASGFASGSASHELHHMELTSYLRGFQQTFQPFIYLCVYPCTHTYIYIYRDTYGFLV